LGSWQGVEVSSSHGKETLRSICPIFFPRLDGADATSSSSTLLVRGSQSSSAALDSKSSDVRSLAGMMKTSTCVLHETDRLNGRKTSTCDSQSVDRQASWESLVDREGGSWVGGSLTVRKGFRRGASSGTDGRTELRWNMDESLETAVRVGALEVCVAALALLALLVRRGFSGVWRVHDRATML